MFISKRTLNEILEIIGNQPIESGGIIGCINNTICAFTFDSKHTSKYEYRPDVEYLNTVIQQWNSQGISFCGIVHSHLYGINHPSESDREYAKLLCQTNPNVIKMYFPIVTLNENNQPQITFFEFEFFKDRFIPLEMIPNGNKAYRLKGTNVNK